MFYIKNLYMLFCSEDFILKTCSGIFVSLFLFLSLYLPLFSLGHETYNYQHNR